MNYIVLVTSFILPVILLQKVNWISKNTSENDLYNLEEFDDDIIVAAAAAAAATDDDDDGNVINTDIKNDDDDDIYANTAAAINHERVLLTNDVSNVDINIFNNDDDDDKGNIPSTTTTTTKNENHINIKNNKRGHTRDNVNVDNNNRNINDDDNNNNNNNNDNTDDDDGSGDGDGGGSSSSSHDSNSNNDILLNMSDINLSQKYEGRRFKNIILDGGNAKAISYIGAFKAFADLGYFQNDQYTFTQISGTSTSCLMGFIMGLDIHPQILETLVYNLNVVAKLINFNLKYLLDDQFQKNDKDSYEEISWFDNIKNSYNLLNKNNEFIKLWKYRNSPGLSTERALLKLIYSHILKKSPHYKKFKKIETITFKNIYKITGHKLACFVTNLSKQSLIELSYTKTPNENILNAIYASLTIPGIFKPLQNDDSDILIDGSYLNSFPISMVIDNDDDTMMMMPITIKIKQKLLVSR
ncbi:hypothetical protein DiNV_CH01M_ORF27 [Drosophila innubila nudivirus]|uniref:PNPLA domain-containing protein n=1 Tax=Drosophila innubila nudivirus TaxID=2057187 RepID=A0A2H4UX69_9VIRU|nr:hypothetical protein DiNV_CH01M_ORF27 [Drosophila innubila nudivirus]ATZ81509.1 hypothetical protein DiNV_CH01M_ORF27 [Drosophila innubila nudivirus]